MATTLQVPDISCDGCEDIVETAVSEVDGVESVTADHEASTVVYEGDPDREDVVEAVDFAGYSVAEEAGAETESDADEADEAAETDENESEDEADEGGDEVTEE